MYLRVFFTLSTTSIHNLKHLQVRFISYLELNVECVVVLNVSLLLVKDVPCHLYIMGGR